MSSINITPYFPFSRVNIFGQTVTWTESLIQARPDKRYKPICYVCKNSFVTVHKWVQRAIRDLDFGPAQVTIICVYRQVFCLICGRFLV